MNPDNVNKFTVKNNVKNAFWQVLTKYELDKW